MFIKPSPGRPRHSVLVAIESHSGECISVTTVGTVSAALVIQLIGEIRQTQPDMIEILKTSAAPLTTASSA